MIARLTFFAIATFWLAMNFLLWRAEFGAHGGETPVPLEMVWQKILTAPDASSLSVYQSGRRTGYCEFSTGVGRQMAELDEEKLPTEELVARAGYQVHLTGNVALNDFTNRLKFDGRVQFVSAGQWREINLKISMHDVRAEIHSLATNQSVHVKITSDAAVLERDLTFADLKKPAALIRAFAGDSTEALLDAVDFPELFPDAAAQKTHWDARRTRVRIGTELTPAYRLETRVLGQTVVVEASTLGEILRVQLPGQITARIEEWSRP